MKDPVPEKLIEGEEQENDEAKTQEQ